MTQVCLNCGRSDEETPLLALAFKGEEVHICPQCLPILIHHPEQLRDRLPGLEGGIPPQGDE
jgi:hypothetical protein